MNFEQTEITLYDPQNRCLDLNTELSPFFRANGEWQNHSVTGNYLSCAKLLINQRLARLGLMCVTKPEEVDPKDVDSFNLVLCSGMAVQKGYVFPPDELELLKALASKSQIIITPELPDLPMYDSVREQFNLIKSALQNFH